MTPMTGLRSISRDGNWQFFVPDAMLAGAAVAIVVKIVPKSGKKQIMRLQHPAATVIFPQLMQLQSVAVTVNFPHIRCWRRSENALYRRDHLSARQFYGFHLKVVIP
jgi:hypothetical protein